MEITPTKNNKALTFSQSIPDCELVLNNKTVVVTPNTASAPVLLSWWQDINPGFPTVIQEEDAFTPKRLVIYAFGMSGSQFYALLKTELAKSGFTFFEL